MEIYNWVHGMIRHKNLSFPSDNLVDLAVETKLNF